MVRAALIREASFCSRDFRDTYWYREDMTVEFLAIKMRRLHYPFPG